eukprot:4851583-Prymnesium_polylepis.1
MTYSSHRAVRGRHAGMFYCSGMRMQLVRCLQLNRTDPRWREMRAHQAPGCHSALASVSRNATAR